MRLALQPQPHQVGSTRRRPPARPGERRSERGAGLVELALVALLLFTMAGATFDYGRAWRTGLAANEGVRTGARVGSGSGPDRAADFNALSGVKASLAASGLLDDVERVVVFQASTEDGIAPSSCTDLSSGPCQIISGDQFRTNWEQGTYLTETQTNGCLNIATHRNWCPTTRVNAQADAQFYGVWVQVRHDYLFPIIGDSTNIERTAVMRLEPEVE